MVSFLLRCLGWLPLCFFYSCYYWTWTWTHQQIYSSINLILYFFHFNLLIVHNDGLWMLQVIDMKTQVSYFMNKAKNAEELRNKISSAVYLFSIGTNDYMTLFLTNSTSWESFPRHQYVDMVIGNLTTLVKVSN